MNVLILDSDCCGTDLAYRAAEAGHNVRWWQPAENGRWPRDGEGFPDIQKIKTWKESMSWAKQGLVINLFNTEVTKELERYRGYGFSIFGPSVKSADLEIKRAKGMQALTKAGVQVPSYETYNSLEQALKAAGKSQDRQVFKTLGDEEDKSLSYVASSPEDMVWRIESWIDQGMKLKGPCMLQKFIEGIEVGISCWMGSKGRVSPWNVNFEFKKMMPGDFGPATGEMGTVCKYTENSRLAEQTLAPMEKLLLDLGHIGDVDLNCIVDDSGQPWCLEWTSRFGWPSTQILCASHYGDPVKWMKDACKGKESLQVSTETAMGVLMAAPPFPHPDEDQQAEGLLVSGIDENWQNVSPWQVRIENKQYLTTGPYVCVATALGPDVHDAKDQVYATVDKIKFPNRIVRNDVGARLEKQLPQLHALGYSEMPRW